MINISQHSITLPLTQFVSGNYNVNSSGKLISTSYPIHTTGKLYSRRYADNLNSILFYRSALVGLVDIRTFENNSQDIDTNGNKSYSFSNPLKVGVSPFNYISIAQGENDFQVCAVLWNQPVVSLNLSQLSFGNVLSLDVLGDELDEKIEDSNKVTEEIESLFED